MQKNTWLTTPEIRELVKELRKLIHEAVSEFIEVVRWGNLSYQTRKKRYVCTMPPHNAHVNIHFWHGRELRDLQIPLHGLGKKLRNIKIDKPGDINGDSVEALIMEAFELEKS